LHNPPEKEKQWQTLLTNKKQWQTLLTNKKQGNQD
jgi:hypothetical protein